MAFISDTAKGQCFILLLHSPGYTVWVLFLPFYFYAWRFYDAE